MRRTILLGVLALFAAGAANQSCAQRRGGAGFAPGRGGYGVGRARAITPRRPGYRSGYANRSRGFGYGNGAYGLGYAYLPFDAGYEVPAYDSGGMYPDSLQPAPVVQQPPVQPAAPPVAHPPGHPVITEYKWTAAELEPPPTEPEPPDFAIVLKNGSTLSAVAVFASDNSLHYVDPDDRHLRVSLSQVDRAATLKLNRARNLSLYLPAAD